MERRVEERAVKYFIRDWSLLFTAWDGVGGGCSQRILVVSQGSAVF